jgi:quinol monooxygenase YgiN
MAIECINTIEIRLFEALDSNFSVSARACLEGLQNAPGCLDYTLTRSSKEGGLWWLTGYWETQGEMTASFESAAMMRLINCLIEAGASLNFGSFVCLPASAHGD